MEIAIVYVNGLDLQAIAGVKRNGCSWKILYDIRIHNNENSNWNIN